MDYSEINELKEVDTIKEANALLGKGWTLIATRVTEDVRFKLGGDGNSYPYHITPFVYLLGHEKPLAQVELTPEQQELAK